MMSSLDVMLRVFVLYLLPLPGLATSAIIVFGSTQGLSPVALAMLYLLNSVIVVTTTYFITRCLFARSPLGNRILVRADTWRAATSEYLGEYGIGLGLMSLTYATTWWVAIPTGVLLQYPVLATCIAVVAGDTLLFLTYLALTLGFLSFLPVSPVYVAFVLLAVTVAVAIAQRLLRARIRKRQNES